MATNKEAILKKIAHTTASVLVAALLAVPGTALALNDYTTWTSKIKIKVNNPTATNATDYPVRIEVPAKTYIDAGKMNSDMRDIRFADSGGNPLPFWINVTENMVRQFNDIPVYVKLKTMNAGDNIIYMYFDKAKTKYDKTPKTNYTASDVTTDYCGDGGITSLAPYSSINCGNNAFSLHSFDCSETDWTQDASCLNATNKRWVSKVKFGTTNNSIITHFRTHFYTNKGSFYTYFLTQNTAVPALGSLDMYCGYRLWYEYVSTSTNADTMNMDSNKLHIQRKTTNCGTSTTGWADVAPSPFTNWKPYNNSIQDIDIKTNATKIDVFANNSLIGTVNRGADGWTGGYVGFNRGGWNQGAEGGSNSTDGISPIWVISNYVGAEPVVTFLGNADLTVIRIQPTADAAYTGLDTIENTAKSQVLDDNVDGNTLEKYVYSGYPLASPTRQLFKDAITIRNRGDVSDTFDIKVIPTGDTTNWSIAYDYGSGLTTNLPGTGGTNTTGSITLAAGASQLISVYALPSQSALFEGSSGRMILDFNLTSRSDASFDNARLNLSINGKSGCYWKWKLPITVSYTDTNSTGKLLDYQIQLNLSGMDFSDARTDGADIIFTDSLGTALPFWQKSYNKSTGTASYWIKAGSIPPGNSTIYMWWGNSSYFTPRSDKKATFDLWEDWEDVDYVVGNTVGCPDGTTAPSGYNCSGQGADPNGWQNYPTPADNYNWWKIRSKLDGKALMADKGSTNSSSDIGPMLAGGDVRWKSYELTYSFYDEYNNYSGGSYGNPQYNPVYFKDAGNSWGIEFFSNLFIFRPFAKGTDWTWTYQASVSSKLGGWNFITMNKRYWIKTRLFQRPSDGRTLIKLFIAPTSSVAAAPTDTDSDSQFTEITPSGGYLTDANLANSSGMIGFGGWNGGFSYDNIRIRKYTEPEPACTAGTPVLTNYSPINSLSSPIITPPLLNGRPVFLSSNLSTFSWRGDLTAIYADCFVAGDCQAGEDASKLGTISLWGKVSDTKPKGFGDQLKLANAGDNNRTTVNDSSWQTSGRYIFTSYDANGDGKISCSTAASDCIGLNVSNASTLKDLLGYGYEASPYTETTNLVRFVRGKYISAYPRSTARNDCSSGTADNCQWKMGDVAHSNPLVIGVPNMLYADPAYSTFQAANNSRDLVTYFSSNDGLLHAVRMATYSNSAKKYSIDSTATELWSYVPNSLLDSLSKTTDTIHEYTNDGLLRAIDIKTSTGYKTVLVGGLRNGGQSIFALDVTDPSAANLLWEINQSTNSTAFAKIGRSWSAPALGRLCESNCDPTSTTNRWVAVVGSGFDPNDIGNLSKTAYLSFIDLETGAVIKQIQVSSKVGNITTNLAVLRDKNGYLQKIVFGDAYGAVWRVNLTNSTQVATILAAGKTVLGDAEMLFKPADYAAANMTSAPPQRPTTAQPTIAYSKDTSGNDLFWVFLGTGAYDIYDSTYPYQRVYGLKDNVSTPYLDSGLTDMTLSSSTNATKQSWFMELGHNDAKDYGYSGSTDATCISSCTATGYPSDFCNSRCRDVTSASKDRNERVLSTPIVYGGFVFFSAFTPANNACGGGDSQFYALSYETGSYNSGLLLFGGGKTDGRSIRISSNGGVPSAPMVYSGKTGGGQVVASGLVDVSTGGLNKTPLDASKFSLNVNILLWRKIR